MKNELIIIDLDCTCNDFVSHFCQTAYEKHDMRFDGDVYECYDLTHCMTKSKKENDRVLRAIFSSKEFWATLPIMPDCFNVLNQLRHKGYVLEIATALPPKADYKLLAMVKEEKLKWIDKQFPTIKFRQIHFTAEKYLLKGDYLIDDNPKFAECDGIKFSGKWIKYQYGYNKDHTSDYTVANWKEINKLFASIEKDKQ